MSVLTVVGRLVVCSNRSCRLVVSVLTVIGRVVVSVLTVVSRLVVSVLTVVGRLVV